MVDWSVSGVSPANWTKSFKFREINISAWVRQARADEMCAIRSDAPLTTTERQELSQLRRQLRQVTQELDSLVKATAWFAN